MRVPQCTRNVSSEAGGAMLDVGCLGCSLVFGRYECLLRSWGRRREKRKVEDLGRVRIRSTRAVANKDSQASA